MIKMIVWDLDDTLLDTSSDLNPRAVENIFQSWKKLKPELSREIFYQRRQELLPYHSNRKLFQLMSGELQMPDPAAASELAIQYFYYPQIDHDIFLLPGARENLEYAQKKNYIQLMLTAGDSRVQNTKVDKLNIRHFFQEIHIADKNVNNEKNVFFSRFAEAHRLHPSEIISIGNRRQSEIRHAKIAGCKTCLFNYGEHIHDPIEVPADIPDFQVEEHSVLMVTCQL